MAVLKYPSLSVFEEYLSGLISSFDFIRNLFYERLYGGLAVDEPEFEISKFNIASPVWRSQMTNFDIPLYRISNSKYVRVL